MARPLASALFATLEPPVDAADPTADPTTSTSPRCAFGCLGCQARASKNHEDRAHPCASPRSGRARGTMEGVWVVPAAPGEVSDTGQLDLLRLLATQGTAQDSCWGCEEGLKRKPRKDYTKQVPGGLGGLGGRAELPGPSAAVPVAEAVEARGSLMSRTLQLPGITQGAPEKVSSVVPGPVSSVRDQRTSIAAALLQTTPEDQFRPSGPGPADLLDPPQAELQRPHPAEKESQEALALLNRATAELQQNRLSHASAADTFTELLRPGQEETQTSQLPPGRLRCSALLNRAHCYVGMGQLHAALEDIQAITEGHRGEKGEDGFDARQWHKVWMSRGGIHRKLAQLTADPAESARLYAQSKADYEYVLLIQPPNESYVAKAQLLPPRSRSRSPAPAPIVPALSTVPAVPAVCAAATVPATALDTPATGPRAGSACAAKALEALGEECVAAGRRLFEEGAVTCLKEPREDRRRYEVLVLGLPELVELQRSTDWSGSCSCRLNSHCKHVAAALCAEQAWQERELQELQAAEPQASVASERRTSGATAASASGWRLEVLARRLERKTNDELKNYLRLNGQLLSGAKGDLAQRLAEATLYGALAPCPRCGGHLHPEEPSVAPDTLYYCKRQLRDREACGYQALIKRFREGLHVGGCSVVLLFSLQSS
eukprot:g17249.t1